MRMVGRSESHSLPSLDTLLPMEKSWASEVEKEEETLFLQARSENLCSGNERVTHTETSWVSCKRLNSDRREAFYRGREGENERYIKRPSRSFESKPFRSDQHHISSRPLGGTEKAWRFTSSSRCYPPSANITSSDFSVPLEERASRLQTQRGECKSRAFVRTGRSSGSFVSRQHFMGLKDRSFRANQGVKPSVDSLNQRQDQLACLDHKRRETASVYEASRRSNDHGDDYSHFQGHQEPDESKDNIQPLFDKHRQHRYSKNDARSDYLEHRTSQRCAKLQCQGSCHGLSDQKNVKPCRRSIGSGMKQHAGTSLAGKIFEKKHHITNGESVPSDAATATENSMSVGFSVLESSHTGKSNVEHDDSIIAMEQYEMLACLLFDDLQDVNADSGMECVGEGSGCECSGSIFYNESEVNMDTDDVREVQQDMSGKPSAACTANQYDCNFSEMASVVKSSATQPSENSQDGSASSGLKKSLPVLVDVTNKYEIHSSGVVKGISQEDDTHRLSQRQRQVDFGKNTLGYERYTELVPRIKRKAKDPQTPNPKQVCSKRSWDGQIRKWRRLLHVYDPPSEDGEEIAEDFSILKLHKSNLRNDPDAKQATSSALRLVEADESKACNDAGKRKNVGDANLTIYEDWMES